jgi:hypothetical protein
MKFQLPKNDLSNRDEEGRSELKNVIIKIWLGMRDSNLTNHAGYPESFAQKQSTRSPI